MDRGVPQAAADRRVRADRAVALVCGDGRDLRLADLTSRRAPGLGVAATLGAGEDYQPSHAFAADAVAAGFDGVRYLARHDPSQRLYSVALFAPAGAPDPADPAWPKNAVAIPRELIEEARRPFGSRVLPAP